MKTAFSIRRLAVSIGAGTLLAMSINFAQAQNISAAHLESAKKAISAIHATDPFDNFLPNTALDLKDELMRKDPNLSNMISDIVDEQAMALIKRRADLETEAARVYANHFTQAELDQITAFYNTDAGKKLLKEGPDTMKDVASAFEVWRQGIARDLSENVGKEMSEKLSKASPANPTAPVKAVPAKAKEPAKK